MAARTIEDEKNRRMTIMTTTFVPCGAKLPVIALIAGAIMGGSWWMAPLMYFIGVFAVIAACIILKKTKMFAGDPSPFVIELPQYHIPDVKTVLMHVWAVSYTHLLRFLHYEKEGHGIYFFTNESRSETLTAHISVCEQGIPVLYDAMLDQC